MTHSSEELLFRAGAKLLELKRDIRLKGQVINVVHYRKHRGESKIPTSYDKHYK